jgi:glutaredoxin
MKKVQLIFTQSCGYCGPAKEIFRNLQTKHNFEYEEIDAATPQGQELVQKFDIMAVPTIIINDKVQFVGLPDRNRVEEIINGDEN